MCTPGMRRTWRWLIVGGSVLGTSCAPAAAPPPPVAAAPSTAPAATKSVAATPTAAPLTHLRVGYAAPSANFTPLYVAMEAGLFEKYGLTVEPVLLTGTLGPQALVAGEIPLMAIGGTVVAPPVSEGAELVQLSSSVHRLSSQVWALPEIDSPEALRGKRLAITRPGTLTDFSARLVLREAKLKPAEDVVLVTLNDVPTILAGLLAGATDAGVLTDPYTFAAGKQGLRLLADLSDYPTEFAETGWTTSPAYLRENRPLLLRFLKGYVEGVKRFFDDKDFTIQAVRKYVGIEDPEALDQMYTRNTQKLFVRVPFVTVQGMQNVLDAYAETNPRAREVDPTKVVDGSLIEDLRREGFFRALGLE